jgi:haloacetate dehalogenase
VLTDDAVTEYERCFDRGAIHASCEDYRAGATIDLEHDNADADAQLVCPTLVLWSATALGELYDVSEIWGARAPQLEGLAFNCGHFLAEERPEQVAAAILQLLADGRS